MVERYRYGSQNIEETSSFVNTLTSDQTICQPYEYQLEAGSWIILVTILLLFLLRPAWAHEPSRSTRRRR